MAYYLNLFSPETYEAFIHSGMNISGFRLRQQSAASKIKPGDKLLCYMTKLSRWVGILEIGSDWFQDDTPIFYEHDDPFIVRFHVKPVIWLQKEYAFPIRDNRVWDVLSFTRGHDKSSSKWTGKLRVSLNQISDKDGQFIEKIIVDQNHNKEVFEIDETQYNKLITHRIQRLDKTITVSVPQSSDQETFSVSADFSELRESFKIQALIANIGAKMGMKIWLPRSDRSRVLSEWADSDSSLLDRLPLNYDDTTLKTIEQIDVLWLKGRAIARAFEVEHTTSIYSGILRMADLLALQPNIDIRLHIVAPEERRDNVFEQILRPVFSLLDGGPLSESCTYISYDSLRELAKLKHISHYVDSVLDEYAEIAE
ncbi:MAG: EVE domain-containing protein [Anaerolineae bacterium]|nr:EVE domain-containing protein [Anaerolineae bacterium]